MGRLTNGFNMAANEKSKYLSSMLYADPEMQEAQAESIMLNINNVWEEQEVDWLNSRI